MKKETLKELGKLHYDVAKIIIAVIIVGGIVKNDKIYHQISIPAIFITIGIIAVGTILINKGAKDE
jgi:FtsH-binding integral membrane protein